MRKKSCDKRKTEKKKIDCEAEIRGGENRTRN